MTKELLSIGKILNFHGIKGEVKVGYSKGKENQISAMKKMYITKHNETITLNVSNIKFNNKFALIKFKEFNSIEDMMEHKGAFLHVEKEALSNFLEDDEFYIDDLVGMKIYDTDDNLAGEVISISNSYGRDLLTVKVSEGKTKLVPFVKDLVPVVDLENKKIIVNNIPGLLDDAAEISE